MQIKRKIEIFTATNRRFVVRRQIPEPQIVCPVCGNGMLTAEHLAKFFNVSQRRVFQYLEAGAVHFNEEEGGATLICIASFADGSGLRPHEDSDKLQVS